MHYSDEIITVVRVFPRDYSASFHVDSLMKLTDDRIASLDEYWADNGEAPAWRKRMGIGKPIRGWQRETQEADRDVNESISVLRAGAAG